jgi:CRP-like cAMP-binding protein
MENEEMARSEKGDGLLPKNRLLAGLPRADYLELLPHLEPVGLEFKQIICEPGERMRGVYFPSRGVVSMLSVVPGTGIELGTIGREGMVGLRRFLGDDTSPFRFMVQVPGEAMRLGVEELIALSAPTRPLYSILCRYCNALITQIAQSVACNAAHSIKQRCCRWLLMTHDRVQVSEIPLTQEFLAQMLGVRRASVAEVARGLQKSGLIRSSRGAIHVLDRKRLEAASCECYRIVKDEFDRLIG